MRVAIVASALLGLVVAGCSDFSPGAECSAAKPCPSGQSCIQSACVDDTNVAEISVVGEGAFAEGTLENVEHDGTGLVLVADAEGVWTSPIFDSGFDNAEWSEFSWTPSAPYGKPLPDDGGIETGYRAGNSDMTANALLIHCDDDETVDASGQGNALAPFQVGDVLAQSLGLVGKACRVGMGNHMAVALDETTMEAGANDFSWAAWVNTNTPCEGNDVFIGADAEQLGGGGTHQWLGCALAGDERGPDCPVNSTSGLFAGVQVADQAEVGGATCTETVINDGNWHHIAVVKEGFPSYSLSYYIDGANAITLSGESTTEWIYGADDLLVFGSFPSPGFESEGTTLLDEVAIFSRALSARAIADMFERGAGAISIQLRSCDDPECVGEAFVGADGDSANTIAESAGSLTPPAPVALTVAPGRYVQFRVALTRFSPTATPRLENATLRATRP